MKKLLFMVLFGVLISLNAEEIKIQPITEEMEPWQIKSGDYVGGVSVDIVKEIQKRVGNDENITVLPWNRAYNMALKNSSFALFSTTKTDYRKNLFKWVGPILPYEVVVYKLVSNKKVYKSLDDAKNAKSIAVTKNDAISQYLISKDFKNLRIYIGGSAQENLERLLEGGIELLPLSNVVGDHRIKKLAVSNKVIKTKIPPFCKSGLYIAFNKDAPEEIVNRWQSALDEMKRDGTYESILKSYID